jgi:hypothetical protein
MPVVTVVDENNVAVSPRASDFVIMPSTDLTANGNTLDFTNVYAHGVAIWINTSAFSGTAPTIQVTLQGKDPASGLYATIITSNVISTVALQYMPLYGAGLALPHVWRLAWTIGGSNTPLVTTSFGGTYMV